MTWAPAVGCCGAVDLVAEFFGALLVTLVVSAAVLVPCAGYVLGALGWPW